MTTTLAVIGTVYLAVQVLSLVVIGVLNLVARGQRRKLARLANQYAGKI